MFRSLRISHVEFRFPGSEKLGPSRNGRMEQNFQVIPIFRNFRPTSRGTPKISEWNSGKCLFHSLPNPEFPKTSGPVHTYADIFESATFSFRIRLSSTRIRRIRKQSRNFLNPLYRVGIFESDKISDTCGRSNPDIFWYDVVTKLAPVFTSQI